MPDVTVAAINLVSQADLDGGAELHEAELEEAFVTLHIRTRPRKPD